MRKQGLLLALLSLITACNNQSSNGFTKYQDTVSILNCVFNHQSFQAIVTPQTQTLIIIKNKYYQNDWPERIGSFNVTYEEKPSTLASKNHFLYRIGHFEITPGKGTLSIFCVNKKLLLIYAIIKQGNEWKVKTVVTQHNRNKI